MILEITDKTPLVIKEWPGGSNFMTHEYRVEVNSLEPLTHMIRSMILSVASSHPLSSKPSQINANTHLYFMAFA